MPEPATPTSPNVLRASSASAGASPRLAWLALALLPLAAAIVHASSLAGPFVFDDIPSIVTNPGLERIWPGVERFLGRQRTITELTLALNRAVNGLEPGGYRLVNVVIHVLAGLALFGIVRRTLALERFGPRFERSAPWLALIIAALWVLHPLQTQSVTYVVQRAESLMGLFYLLTLYCTLRAATSARGPLWQALAVLACALGMGSKPVMVTAPLVVLAFDRVFLAPSWRALFLRRGWLHLGLCLSWSVIAASGLLASLTSAGESARSSAGFDMEGITPLRYLLTQPGVLLHYLRLSLWPHPLVIDYGWPMVASVPAALPAAFVIAIALVASLVALARGSWVGFLGLWFFAILAPTSSVVPLRDAAFEHRMYLPLAAVVVLVVLLGHALLRMLVARGRLSAPGANGLGLALAAIAGLGLGARTFARNRDYRDDVVLWRSTIRYAPRNARAYNLLAGALAEQGRHEEAIDVLRSGLATVRSGTTTDERVARALATNLANTMVHVGRADEALELYRTLLQEHPDDLVLLRQLGSLLSDLARWDEAVETFRKALAVEPDDGASHLAFGRMYRARGDPARALAEFREAQRLDPDGVDAALEAGRLLTEEFSNWVEAEQAYRSALARLPDDPDTLTHLGLTLEKQGKLPAAIDAYSAALRIQPRSVRAGYAMGRCYEAQGLLERAVREYENVLLIAPDHAWAADALRRIRGREEGS